MPIIWRYLIQFFLKVVVTCVVAFVAILLVMRLDEIAHFAALGAPARYLIFFILYQIPYILPIAIPLSCLIGALLLVQRLSSTHELTALRASGFSIVDIMAPILLTAAFLAIANFWIVSELATHSHLQTNFLKTELRGINPLLLLHNKHLMRLKGFYFDALGASHVGESASDVVLAIPNKHQQRLNLMVAKYLQATPSVFLGNGVTLISGADSEEEEDFDHLLIENMGQSITNVQDFSDFLQKKVWTVNNDYLQMPLLLARIKEQWRELREAKLKEADRNALQLLRGNLNQSFSEIIKRFSIALAVLSFTFMGASFGISISRKKRYSTLYFTIALTTLFLISFFVAKGVDHYLLLAAMFYLIPHLIIILTSIGVLKRIAGGIET